MALDKQRILNELGSVMNQLQSTDCGCMGKLFSNPGQESNGGSPLPTCGGCRRGCCNGHGYGCGSAPYAGDGGGMNMNRSCMGQCNAPRLYADTYSYLNQNLMQPVVKEVYDDLSSISPANSIGNNPLANRMGLSQGNPMMQGNMGGMGGQNQMPGNMQNMGDMAAGNLDNQNANQQMGQMRGGNISANPMHGMGGGSTGGMGGMGAQIASMMMSGGGGKSANMKARGDSGMNQNHAGMGQENMSTPMQAPTNQYVTQDNMYTVGNAQVNPQHMNSGAQNMTTAAQNSQQLGSGTMNPNQVTQPMANARGNSYGQHTQGIMKFNEMFPGVMQGGDLGFDPMAIAMQMNPANQQKAAMESMQKLMNNKPDVGGIQPTNTTTNIGQLNQPQQNLTQNQVPQNVGITNQMANQQMVQSQQSLGPAGQIGNQQLLREQQLVAAPNAGSIPNQQQVYTTHTGAPTMNQQQVPQQIQDEQVFDPNVESPTSYGGMAGDPNVQMQQSNDTAQSQEMYKEPIFPADTSKNQPTYYVKPQKYYQYNTLGQPVQMVPGDTYRTQDPGLPQTLSPQNMSKTRNDPARLGIKATMSKTSIVGNKPVGKTPSRSQLQHIYQQYKGSQSYTQQNIRNPGQSGTHSDGRLNITPANVTPAQQIPLEKLGGDTAANNQVVNKHGMGQNGDVPIANKPHGDTFDKGPVAKGSRCRNGLQDMVYTSYPSHAAWSFHGEGMQPRVPAAYRTRDRYRF